jgi:MinD-like ATPase involved in chromosome partitioning or flagellar assembly
MTPNERDNPEASEELPTTELYPYASSPGYSPALDGTLPDVPVMEPLPDPDALPDPGYPVMPATAGHQPGGFASPARFTGEPPRPDVDLPRATGQVEPARPVDGPSARSWPRPPAWPPEGPAFNPAGSSSTASSSSAASDSPLAEAGPYAAPRAPDDAPPLRGPSVPWSEVRAAADHTADGEPLAAPPSLRLPQEAGPEGQAAPDVAATGRPTSDVLTSDLLLPGKRATPDGGWRRAVYRATGGLIRVGESSASLRHRDLVNRIRTPVVGGHHRVAVLSLKGGVGKTTATVCLGATLASLRGDRVIAVDGNPDRGTLSDKVRLETTATIRDLLNQRAMVARYADVRAFTSQTSSRLEILASDRDPGVSVAFSADDYRAVAAVLEHYYSICITDCGTGLLHSAMAGILELADQIVLVSSPSVDGARSASATLDWLEAHEYGDLVRGGVVALSAVRRKTKSTVDLERLEQHFAARCRAVVRIPYDTHLEEGAEVELDYLNPETADAYLTLAALVADGFITPRRSPAGAAPGFPLA